mmetsp:Transcript_80596/g.209485  ORF Transcript_80596/g.209485 Transcript_80596/m.209485 type:complete len:248 (-) Transcript_80596:631-1374(-)
MREGAVLKTNHLQKASRLQASFMPACRAIRKREQEVLPLHHPLPYSVEDVHALGRHALLEALHVGLELLHVGTHGGLHRDHLPELARGDARALLHDPQISLNLAARVEVVDRGSDGAEHGVKHQGAREVGALEAWEGDRANRGAELWVAAPGLHRERRERLAYHAVRLDGNIVRLIYQGVALALQQPLLSLQALPAELSALGAALVPEGLLAALAAFLERLPAVDLLRLLVHAVGLPVESLSLLELR